MIRLLFLALCIFFAMSNINYVDRLFKKTILIIFFHFKKTSNNNVNLTFKLNYINYFL